MENETTWIDAWIRWDRNSKDIVDEDQNDDFKDEERDTPTTEFSFDYKLPAGERDDELFDLTLTLKGFPSESEQIWNSTGLTLWPSSHYLCEYLICNYHELLLFVPTGADLEDDVQRTIRAVELGSGLGRCGLLMHHIMATQHNVGSHVYLTDGDTDTLAQLRDNVNDNTNRDSGAESQTSMDDGQKCKSDSNPHTISCHQLLWGKDSAESFCERRFRRNSTGDFPDTANNEKNHRSGDSVDLVFGSDLIYAPRVIDPLFETVSALLATGNKTDPSQQETVDDTPEKSKGTFLMAHSDRREGSSVTLKMVLEGAETAGFRFNILEKVEREGIYIIAFQI